jgi:endonuclease/exonuclease/phosphatase family metal-dependent hydrolase
LNFAGSSGVFSLSKDGTSYSSSLTYTVAEANNISKTVYVRFTPSQADRNYFDSITIATGGLDTGIVLKGSSLDPVKTLEVVNWNLEWFGSTEFGPTNDNLQEQNVRTIMQSIGADLFALEEVVDETRLQNIVNSMPGYAYVINHYGSHTNPNESNPEPLSSAQRLAFVYKTSVFSNIDTAALLSVGINTPADIGTTSYNNWASGRFPFLMSADVTLDGVTKNIKFIVVHAKANTAPTIPSYNRRKAGADELHDLINTTYGSDNVVLLGDFNDDLDQTITDGINPPTTSYVAFTTDASNFSFPTLPLSQAGKRSTVTHDNVIDHVVLSNELGSNFINASATILTDAAALIPSYGTTTTDHYPVFTRYTFSAQSSLPIKLNYFTAEKNNEAVNLSWSSALESNSKEYRIERSVDGRSFIEIGTVHARGVASKYQFQDQAPLAGDNFYRLKMVDMDGAFEYSKSIRVKFEKQILITVKPNPAARFAYVTLSGAVPGVSLGIYDVQGRLVKQLTLNGTINPMLKVDLNGIPNGMYILKLSAGEYNSSQKLIIRQ